MLNSKIIKLSHKGQGTIEYLVIIGIVVVIALVVVGLLTSFLGSGSQVNETATQISAQTGKLSIAESAVTPDGNYLLRIKNLDSEQNTITSVIVTDSNNKDYSEKLVLNEAENFVIPSEDTCIQGTKITKTITINYTTRYGIQKTQTQTITFPCENYTLPEEPVSEGTSENIEEEPEVDTTAPTISLSSENINSYNISSIDFTFSVTDSDVNYCFLILDDVAYLDNNVNEVLADVEYSISYSDASIGSHTWDINCVDTSGNSALAEESGTLSQLGKIRLTFSGNTQTLTDYSVKIIVPKKDEMQTDYNDLRFKDSLGIDLNYWKEDYNSSYGIFWVKIPTLTGSSDTNLDIVYGGGETTDNGNQSEIFYFYDEFNGDTLDTSKWLVRPRVGNDFASGNNVVADGNLKITEVTNTIHTYEILSVPELDLPTTTLGYKIFVDVYIPTLQNAAVQLLYVYRDAAYDRMATFTSCRSGNGATCQNVSSFNVYYRPTTISYIGPTQWNKRWLLETKLFSDTVSFNLDQIDGDGSYVNNDLPISGDCTKLTFALGVSDGTAGSAGGYASYNYLRAVKYASDHPTYTIVFE